MFLRTTPKVEALSTVGVLAMHGEVRAIAARDFEPDDVVLRLEGILLNAPTRHSIQVGPREHLEMPDGIESWQVQIETYPWRFLNHSCSPNTKIADRDGPCLVALVEIRAGTELGFDYESNEHDLAEPFLCRCPDCGGRQVRGFLHLSQAEREARRGMLSDHLLPLLDDPRLQGR